MTDGKFYEDDESIEKIRATFDDAITNGRTINLTFPLPAPISVSREQIYGVVWKIWQDPDLEKPTDFAQHITDAILNLLANGRTEDEIRREHGERIAQAIEDAWYESDSFSVKGDADRAARIARELSDGHL